MKIKTLLFFMTIILSSCFDAPEFSDTPKISFESITFKEGGSTSSDSLTISIDFEDGDGNLGLDERFEFIPFNSFNFFVDNKGNLITKKYLDSSSFELYGFIIDEQRFLRAQKYVDSPPFELPPDQFPEKCTHWQYGISVENFFTLAGISFQNEADEFFFIESLNVNLSSDGLEITDTIYYELNPNNENLILDILILDPSSNDFEDIDGKYRIFDWVTDIVPGNNCGADLKLRFPVLNDLNDDSPTEGTIKYSLVSPLLSNVWGSEHLKLRIKIMDRDFNESNTVYSPLFTLSEIRVN